MLIIPTAAQSSSLFLLLMSLVSPPGSPSASAVSFASYHCNQMVSTSARYMSVGERLCIGVCDITPKNMSSPLQPLTANSTLGRGEAS